MRQPLLLCSFEKQIVTTNVTTKCHYKLLNRSEHNKQIRCAQLYTVQMHMKMVFIYLYVVTLLPHFTVLE